MDDEPWGEGEANALLIAAAPELLGNARKNLATMEETARRLERAGMSHHELDLAIDQTRAAIAEAEGLAPSSAKQVAGDSSRDDHNE